MPLVPSTAVFNVTLRCQLKCKICSIESATSNHKELTTEKVINILEDLSRGGISTIDFVGGEILVRGDIVEILRVARVLFKEVRIVTNGLEGLKYADFFLSLPLDHITISLDGSNSATHDSIRGDGVFNRTMEFLNYLKSNKERNCKPFTTISTVIVKNNISELIDILKLADSLHINNITYEVFLYDNENLKLRKTGSPYWVKDEDLTLLDKQIKRILEIKEKDNTAIYVASKTVYLSNVVNYYSGELKPDLFTCRSGIDFVSICSDGDMYICDFILGNVEKDKFLTIWNSKRTEDALMSVAHCMKPCMMNCMVGGVDYHGRKE